MQIAFRSLAESWPKQTVYMHICWTKLFLRSSGPDLGVL